MKFSDLFKFSVRRKVRGVIWKSQDAIEKCEAALLDASNSLIEMLEDPNSDRFAVRQMERAVVGMVENLKALKLNHARFIAENRKPSPAFKHGISA